MVGILLLVLATAGAVWRVQDWRYGKQLAEPTGSHQADLTAIGNAVAAKVQSDLDKRMALEPRLSVNEQTHYKELSDVQTNQAHLRDRLASADLRLSVLLDANDPAGSGSVSAATGAVGVVHELAPNLTQRMLNELSPSPMPVTKD